MTFTKLALVSLGTLCFGAQPHPDAAILGPYVHDNLAVFLIQQGDASLGGTVASKVRYLALQTAMEQKKVIVYETRQVNDLAIENISSDTVFIQQGDIVKGGDQDRMISNDFILPPNSGRLSLSAFCVESGRWNQRGNEPRALFSGSPELGAIRFDPKAMWSQMSVWEKVSGLQEALASRLHRPGAAGSASVRVAASPTSLMLTQTSPPVEDAIGVYTEALVEAVRGATDVIGYAFAVNGEMKSADVYSSPDLFLSMWPKLLKSSAVEAVRVREQAKTPSVEISQVKAFLREAGGGKETTRDVDGRTKLTKRESERLLLVESRDGTNWVHRNVVKK